MSHSGRTRFSNLFTGDPFPADFINVVKTVFKRLFRVYAHIYYSHLSNVIELKLESHYNTLFKHIALFILEFDLVRLLNMYRFVC